MDDSRYLETINKMSNTIEKLAIDKDDKVNGYKKLITRFIIAFVIMTGLFVGCIGYFVYSIYNYNYTVSNENINTNTNKNGGVNQ